MRIRTHRPSTRRTLHRQPGWRGLLFLAGLAALASTAEAQLPRPLSAFPASVTATPQTPASGSRRASASPHGDIAIACDACHTSEGWRPLREAPDFEHRRDTGYGLEARHAQASCQSCHLGLRFTGLDGLGADCGSCHVDVHRAALDDACQSCHEPTDWALVDGVEVHAQTVFPLTGAHLQVSCESCHTAGRDAAAFSQLPADCLGCHQDALASTENSLVPHVASGFPADCETCHHTTAWSAGPFDHASVSGGFTLVGAHDGLACGSCHAIGPDFTTLFDAASPNECLSCHQSDQANARIDHDGFPTDCTQCHTVQTWQGATADHVTLSGGFALVGAHMALDCSSCHLADLTPLWTPASQTDCIACHQDDYQATANSLVDHVAGGFPTTCTECHGVDQWSGATFDHGSASGGFSLVGAHETLACASCHSEAGGGVPWTPASPDDCASCHKPDADAATPDHTGFPTTCTDCHTTGQWQGATIEHPQFPIFSGDHRGEWDSCQTCHVQPGDFRVFSCLTCHEHGQSEMDDEHDDVGGYVYESTACYSCHPDGEDDLR